MNSLMGYGSDDLDDSSEEKITESRAAPKDKRSGPSRKRGTPPTDDNYEEVQMDLSEESNDCRPEKKRKSRDQDEHKKRHRSDRRDKERRSRRSSSREKRRSRTPSRERRRSRTPPKRERSRDRSRKYPKRHERSFRGERSDRNVAPKVSEVSSNKKQERGDGGFFMPGISGRFRDQIERRKQLWQKKESEPVEAQAGQSTKVWQNTTFAQDTDGKVATKFKRLMGIRGANPMLPTQGTEVLKKQEEMFSSMEQQYEVARTATHTMRGVGLGFGSYPR